MFTSSNKDSRRRPTYFVQGILALIIVSLVVPSALFLAPKRAVAQANGNQFACAAGLVTAAAVGVLGAVFGVIGVKNDDGPGTLAEITNTNGSWTEIVMKCVLKPIAMSLVLNAIKSTGDSIVDWINNDFNGNPRFSLNLRDDLLDAMDQAIGGYLEGGGLSFLCDGPLKARINLTLQRQYARREPVDANMCTLTGWLDNLATPPEVRANLLYGNGWDNWIRISTDPTKSQLGALLASQNDLGILTALGAEEKEKEITIGEGFLADKQCTLWETQTEWRERTRIPNDQITAERYFNERKCLKEEVITPGSTIAKKVSSAIGNEDIQLAVADEIEEIINALATQAYNKVIGGVGGLLGGGGKKKPYTRQFIGSDPPRLSDGGSTSRYDDTPDVWSLTTRGPGQDGEITIEDYLEWQRIRCRPETAQRYPQAASPDNQRYCRTQGLTGGLVDDYTDDYINNNGTTPNTTVTATNLVTNNRPVSASTGPNAGKAIDGIKDNPSTLGGFGGSGDTDIVLWSRQEYRGTQMVRYQIVDSELPRTFSVSPSGGQDPGASSIQIPDGYRVTMFGRGSSVVVTEDTDSFGDINFNNGQGVQDWVNSIRIERSSDEDSSNEINTPMRTNSGGAEWWQINLQSRNIITRVVIYRNTAKTVPQTLGDRISILVSDDGINWTTAYSENSQTLVSNNANSNVLTIAMPANIVGQYVRIQKSGQPGFPLEFTEAEVWGKPGPALDQDTFYTSNETLRQQALDCCSYREAGIEGYVYPTGQGGRPEGTTPLYALWGIAETNHSYITDRDEADQMVAARGYEYQHEWKGSEAGIEAYVYPPDEPQPSGTVPIYLLWSPIATDHFLTISTATRNRMISLGYVDQGIEGYVYPTQREGTVPLYKLQRGTY